MMLDLNIGKLVSHANYLNTFIVINDQKDKKYTIIQKDTLSIYLKACLDLDNYVEQYDLKASDRQLSRLIGNIEDSISNINSENYDGRLTFESFNRLAEDLLLRLADELELTKCLVVESGKANFYAPETPLFGIDVAARYPSAYQEIEEAGKCLALGRSTACVFHLMRTLEVGIRAIANSLKIPDPTKPAEKNWGVILKKIKEEIDQRQRWKRRADKNFFEESLASLDSIKNPWRNATMHVEKTYTEEEAENIFYVVKAFMMKIASKIDETGRFSL